MDFLTYFRLMSITSRIFLKMFILKGHCHGDFAIFSSKWLKYLTKNFFSNMKLLLEHREGNYQGIFRGKNKL